MTLCDLVVIPVSFGDLVIILSRLHGCISRQLWRDIEIIAVRICVTLTDINTHNGVRDLTQYW